MNRSLWAGLALALAGTAARPAMADHAGDDLAFGRELSRRGWHDLATDFLRLRRDNAGGAAERAAFALGLLRTRTDALGRLPLETRIGSVGETIPRYETFLERHAAAPQAAEARLDRDELLLLRARLLNERANRENRRDRFAECDAAFRDARAAMRKTVERTDRPEGLRMQARHRHATTILLHAEALARWDVDRARAAYAEAVEALTAIVWDYEGYVAGLDAIVSLGRAHLGTGEHDRAAACFRQVFSRFAEGPGGGPPPELKPYTEIARRACLHYARALVDRGSERKEAACFEATVRLIEQLFKTMPETREGPSGVACLHELMRARLGLGDRRAALAIAAELRRRGAPPPASAAEALREDLPAPVLLVHAEGFLKTGRYAEAITAFRAALRAAHGTAGQREILPACHHGLGTAYLALSRPEAASVALEALDAFPGYPRAAEAAFERIHALSAIHGEVGGLGPEAEAAAEKRFLDAVASFLKRHPASPLAKDLPHPLAVAEEKRGRLREAAALYEKIPSDSRYRTRALTGAGRCHYRLAAALWTESNGSGTRVDKARHHFDLAGDRFRTLLDEAAKPRGAGAPPLRAEDRLFARYQLGRIALHPAVGRPEEALTAARGVEKAFPERGLEGQVARVLANRLEAAIALRRLDDDAGPESACRTFETLRERYAAASPRTLRETAHALATAFELRADRREMEERDPETDGSPPDAFLDRGRAADLYHIWATLRLAEEGEIPETALNAIANRLLHLADDAPHPAERRRRHEQALDLLRPLDGQIQNRLRGNGPALDPLPAAEHWKVRLKLARSHAALDRFDRAIPLYEALLRGEGKQWGILQQELADLCVRHAEALWGVNRKKATARFMQARRLYAKIMVAVDLAADPPRPREARRAGWQSHLAYVKILIRLNEIQRAHDFIRRTMRLFPGLDENEFGVLREMKKLEAQCRNRMPAPRPK